MPKNYKTEMEDSCGRSRDFKDQYTPSGNWYLQNYDDSNSDSFYYDNYTSSCVNSNNYHQQKLQLCEAPLPKASEEQIFPELFSKDSCESSMEEEGPFSLRSRIPVPDLEPISGYQMWLESSFMYRRNERERQRVRSVNDGFSRLRNHLPRNAHMRRRQSKVETLRHAIAYIKQLQTLLEERKSINDVTEDR